MHRHEYVDDTDFATRHAGFGTSGNASHLQGDADGDHDVDGIDFLTWQLQSGTIAAEPQATGTVPEPSATFLSTIALGVKRLNHRRWKRKLLVAARGDRRREINYFPAEDGSDPNDGRAGWH